MGNALPSRFHKAARAAVVGLNVVAFAAGLGAVTQPSPASAQTARIEQLQRRIDAAKAENRALKAKSAAEDRRGAAEDALSQCVSKLENFKASNPSAYARLRASVTSVNRENACRLAASVG